MFKRKALIVIFVLCSAFIGLFSLADGADQSLMMATTTSTEDTGLLNYLAPEFKKDTGIELRWTSTGTGKALELGKNCDVDVVLVHAPEAEKKFVTEGFGVNRQEVMYNDFVIMGPKDDPAKIKGKTTTQALETIAKEKAVFVSRGDKSGTHQAELNLWKTAKLPVPDKESWYVQAGQGMLQTIMMASEKKGYTLADRGTFIKYEADQKGNPPLVILVEKDQALFNQYGVIPVNPEKCPKVKKDLADKFAAWLTSDKGQKLIGEFKLLGKALFTPNAKKK
ncbi:MAG: substrate-binding domain-containing protein [Deltaproteobacteria bacterium]|nr:substrate-binding domain-containing protein [Deltaproteobacteria bacterium]